MTDRQRYSATLRCRTWHVWPEKLGIQSEVFELDLKDGSRVRARAAVCCYLNRSAPDEYAREPTGFGTLFWRGDALGLYAVRDHLVKAPEDARQVTLPLSGAERGEVDLIIGFHFPGELPASAHDAIRGALRSLLSMVNLRFADLLIPSGPVQIALELGDTQRSSDSLFAIEVRGRKALSELDVQAALDEFTAVASGSARTLVALELYGAHFSERGAQTRFLLLVMALEVLAVAVPKHAVALALLDKWDSELKSVMKTLQGDDIAVEALESLEKELLFRRSTSIGGNVRALVRSAAPADPIGWSRRAKRIYGMRSTLVHDGSLSAQDLAEAETEARDVLEMVLRSTLQSRIDTKQETLPARCDPLNSGGQGSG